MNGDASRVFMNSVSAWISTVWPTRRNFVAREATARTESARAFFSAAVAAFPFVESFDAATLRLVSATAELGGALVCVTTVSQVYCGRALLISSSRCGQRYRLSSIDLMIATC